MIPRIGTLIIITFAAFLQGCPHDVKPGDKVQTVVNYNATFWGVTDPVSVGSIVRIQGRESVCGGVKSSALSPLIQPIVQKSTDLDQTFSLTKGGHVSADFNLGSGFLKGTSLNSALDEGYTISFSMKGVHVDQLADSDSLQMRLQTIDSSKVHKDDAQHEILAEIEKDTPDGAAPETSTYWIVTKVFRPDIITYHATAKDDVSGGFTCQLGGTFSCGKLDAGHNNDATLDLSGSKAIFVVLHPIYMHNKTKFIGTQAAPIQSVTCS